MMLCRVGNLLGAGMPNTARKSGQIAITIGGSFMAVIAAVMLACRNLVGDVFSDDPEVIKVMASIVPLLCLFQVSGMEWAMREIKRRQGYVCL